MMFRHPYFLWLILAALIPLIREFRSGRARAALGYSAVDDAARADRTWRIVGRRALCLLRTLAIILAVIALARPQTADEKSKVHVEGIAIELVIDNSGSMSEPDMFYNGQRMTRLDAVKHVVGEFVKGRMDDLIGLTVFSAYPSEVCPLTLDYGILTKFFEQVQPDRVFPYTAIGSGILQGVELLKQTQAKSKVMIVLTDGMHNFGNTHPLEAARLAESLGIRIYTIGIIPPQSANAVMDIFARRIFGQGQEVDEETLKQVAAAARGRYFSASDGEKLKKIYAEINRLEKTEQVTEKYLQYREHFRAPLVAALALILAETLLAVTAFRKKP